MSGKIAAILVNVHNAQQIECVYMEFYRTKLPGGLLAQLVAQSSPWLQHGCNDRFGPALDKICCYLSEKKTLSDMYLSLTGTLLVALKGTE